MSEESSFRNCPVKIVKMGRLLRSLLSRFEFLSLMPWLFGPLDPFKRTMFGRFRIMTFGVLHGLGGTVFLKRLVAFRNWCTRKNQICPPERKNKIKKHGKSRDFSTFSFSGANHFSRFCCGGSQRFVHSQNTMSQLGRWLFGAICSQCRLAKFLQEPRRQLRGVFWRFRRGGIFFIEIRVLSPPSSQEIP